MDFKKSEIKQFERLIYSIHLLEHHHQAQGDHLSIERLSDESGIAIPDLPGRIQELQRAGVCTSKVPLTLLITKGVRGDAKSAYERYFERENTLLTYLADKISDKDGYILNPRKLATFFDPQNKQKLKDNDLTNILTGWQSLGWVFLRQRSGGLLEIKAPKCISENGKNPEIESEVGPLSQVIEWLPRHQSLCERLINALYARIDAKSDEKTGARLVIQCDFEDLLEDIYGRLLVTEEEAKSLRKILIWLHQQSILRLTDGLTLFRQALKIRVVKDTYKREFKSGYPKVEKHYREQSRKIHIMAKYGELIDDEQARQALVEDYFKIPPEEFGKKYPNLIGDEVERPLTQADYEKIMVPLNEIQRNIVETEDSAISVIAGPGSGKTRTIVHRIAYLIKVKRLPPDRILVLAYNRNAVRELRIRLRELIGDHTSRLQVFTFHGLALKLLGRILEKSSSFQQGEKDADQPFKELLEEACNLLEANNSDDDTEDIQFRRIQMLGNLEHIFVDEYQDVTEQEYRLIRLLSGLELEDESEQTETVLENEAPEDSEEGSSEKKPKATADKQNRQKNTTTPSLPINLCVIGDDDQNIYSFRGTNTRFILQFEAEYKAKQFLLTENYRSTESIIAVSNRVIQNNQLRCKQLPQEQVSINRDRKGTVGAPVRAFLFSTSTAQAIWITQQVQQWLEDGVAPNEIAVLAREWDHLNEIRALLERLAGVPTYALKGREVKLIQQAITHELLKKFQQDPNLTLQKDESVQGRFQSFFRAANRDPKEPTVKMLLKIAEDLDRERSLGSEDLAIPITAAEIATSIYEFSESPNNSLVNEDAILVTSCHGAKGLEFSKVIVLTDQFPEAEHRIDDERRLFYVSLTRAKDELVLCGQKSSRFLQETELQPTIEALNPADLPPQVYYFDLTPQDVNLGYRKALQSESQRRILALREGDLLKLVPNQYGDGWLVLTERGFAIGALSQKCNKTLSWKGLRPGHFQFQPGEVTVRHIYRHVKVAQDSDEIVEDWYVVIPQIRVYRGS